MTRSAIYGKKIPVIYREFKEANGLSSATVPNNRDGNDSDIDFLVPSEEEKMEMAFALIAKAREIARSQGKRLIVSDDVIIANVEDENIKALMSCIERAAEELSLKRKKTLVSVSANKPSGDHSLKLQVMFRMKEQAGGYLKDDGKIDKINR